MGMDVGFSFYKKKELTKDKDRDAVILEAVKLKDLGTSADFDGEDDSLWISGRCPATYAVCGFAEGMNDYEKGYYPEAVLERPALDGLVVLKEDTDYEKYDYSKAILTSKLLDHLEKSVDFNSEKAEHEKNIKHTKDNIEDSEKQINSLREFQCKAETTAAFDGFQRQIKEYEEYLQYCKEELADWEDDDYDYNHALWIQKYIDEVRRIMKEYPDIIITVWASY